jgi:signal transduction histidine kinase/CheY-like chemotaxis protein
MNRLLNLYYSSGKRLRSSFHFFSLLFSQIAQTGTEGIENEVLIENIRLTNSLALLFAIIMLLGVPTICILVNSKLFLIPVIVEFFINASVLILNHKKKHVAASSTVFYLQATAITYFSLILGESLHMAFMVMFLILIIGLIFSKRSHRKTAFITTILILATLQICYFFKIVPTLKMSYNTGFTVQCFVIAGIIVILWFVGRPYINNNDRIYKVRLNNRTLENDNNSLKIVNNSLKEVKSFTFHDFRNQLQKLFNAVQTIEKQTKLDPNLSTIIPQLDQMFYVLRAMRDEVNGILDDAEIESGKKELVRPEAIDIRSYFSGIVKSNNAWAIKNNCFIQLDISPSFPEVVISDALLLQKITDNLLSNTIKYATRNTVINLTLTADKSTWYLLVKNKGSNIPLEIQKKIFEQFITHKIDHTVIGTGLGLASVKRKVEALGGIIDFESINDVVTLKSTFPLVVGSREALPVELPITINQEDITILIADDDKVILTILVRMFKDNGCHVIEASNGDEVISILEQAKHLPDVILLDNQMPQKSGLETLQYLKTHPIFKFIPVFVISGDIDKAGIFKEAGAVDVIIKPIEKIKATLYMISQHLKVV